MTDNFTHPNDAPEGHRWTLRNGLEWKLLEVGADGLIYGARKGESGQWYLTTHYKDGAVMIGAPSHDLIDAPRKHTVWVFIDGSGFPHAKVNRPTTYDIENLRCTALKQIVITEGEGL